MSCLNVKYLYNLDWLLCHFKVFYIANIFMSETNRILTSEFMMVVPTWSFGGVHAKETDTINTLRTHFKTRENVFSCREIGYINF
jgi:hypothetical protein